MAERVIAVGDIHGCSTAFAALVDRLALTAEDILVVLGDCVDRGPGSRQVLDLMLALEDRCRLIPLLGNHEEMLLAAVDRPNCQREWLVCGGRETLASYETTSAGSLPREHLLYIRTWRDYWETETHFFAHANYDPHQPLDRQEWGYQRWQPLRVTMPKPHQSGKTAIVGHTSQKDGQVLDVGHLVCIDTYCAGGKWLTALETNSGHMWQADQTGKSWEV